MAIGTFDEDLDIISALDDKPAIPVSELKQKFDEGPKKIKEFINNTMIPAINGGGVTIVNNLTTGGTTKVLSAEMGKQLNQNKQNIINYGKTVPTLAVGEIFIQIFD